MTSWKDFLAAHMNVLAGCDFFTVEVLTWRGLMTYCVLFFIHFESRRVIVAGITLHPDREWMEQIGHSATQDTWGYLHPCRYVRHDGDTKFCGAFRAALASGGVKTIPLPARSSNLNAFAERWVRSVKQECLSKLILFGEAPLSRVLAEYSRHYHSERNHQGKSNLASSSVANDLVDCSNTTGAPHEYFDPTGNKLAVVINLSGSVNAADKPAPVGTVVVAYLTGSEVPDTLVVTGDSAPSNPPARVQGKVAASIGGAAADVQFAGLTPGFVGLLQCNIKIPAFGHRRLSIDRLNQRCRQQQRDRIRQSIGSPVNYGSVCRRDSQGSRRSLSGSHEEADRHMKECRR